MGTFESTVWGEMTIGMQLCHKLHPMTAIGHTIRFTFQL